jgi:hypothetical protein
MHGRLEGGETPLLGSTRERPLAHDRARQPGERARYSRSAAR